MLTSEEIAEKKLAAKQRISARKSHNDGLLPLQEKLNRVEKEISDELSNMQNVLLKKSSGIKDIDAEEKLAIHMSTLDDLRIQQREIKAEIDLFNTKHERETTASFEEAIKKQAQKDEEARKIQVKKDLDDLLSLIEPHLDTLLLKKKQLVREDDYGNSDWSLFVKEINYFAEKNIRTKLNLNYVSDDALQEIIKDLVLEYENNKSDLTHNLDNLEPIAFEHGCADLLNQNGWVARVTQASGDQGIDVIATYGNVKVVFQVKKYSQPVGNSAVQEIIAGKAFEQAHVAAVVTNATYTASAKQLANATGVFLLHYSELPSFAEKLGLVETE
ncbi:hypothetical protein LBMAG43_15470 [Methylococcaceae bacterium]|nr:hypothetical protein LBMAG43_15470 [Methylococcaceae bacterium]